MCSQETAARYRCFHNMANKNTLSSLPVTNNYYQTFPRHQESKHYDKFSTQEVLLVSNSVCSNLSSVSYSILKETKRSYSFSLIIIDFPPSLPYLS